MYELTAVKANSYYIESPAKVGLYRLSETEVCLIDSGSDKDAGRKIRQVLDANGWTLKSIYLTHSHADHIGGAAYLQKQTGCRVYAHGAENCFTRYTILEPSFLFGAYPPKSLRHKFMMAQPCEAEELTEDVLPEGWQLLRLPGHCNDMVGFRTPDDVVYLADSLASELTLQKYRVVFAYDIAQYLQTLESLKDMTAAFFVPAHAPVCTDIAGLAQENIDQTLALRDKLLALCAEPIVFEELLKKLFDNYGLQMSFDQYALVGSTVRSYLAWLFDLGLLQTLTEDNRILWARV